MKPIGYAILSVVFLALVCRASASEVIVGTCIGVTDGDTVTISWVAGTPKAPRKMTQKLRLAGIECPENGQNFSREALQFTRSMFMNRPVRMVSIRREGALSVGYLFRNDGLFLNRTLVEKGLAWVNPGDCSHPRYCTEWAGLQQAAGKRGLGLWREKNPCPPWQFRKGKCPRK